MNKTEGKARSQQIHKKNPTSKILLRHMILSLNLDIRLIAVIQLILRENAIYRYPQLTSEYKNHNSCN